MQNLVSKFADFNFLYLLYEKKIIIYYFEKWDKPFFCLKALFFNNKSWFKKSQNHNVTS